MLSHIALLGYNFCHLRGCSNCLQLICTTLSALQSLVETWQEFNAFIAKPVLLQRRICSASQLALNALSFCSAMDVLSDDRCANTHLSLPELTNYL